MGKQVGEKMPEELSVTNFMGYPAIVFEGQDVYFNAYFSGTDPPFKITWAYGDGEIDIDNLKGSGWLSRRHKYMTKGSYRANVEVVSARGKIVRYNTILIDVRPAFLPPPIHALSISPDVIALETPELVGIVIGVTALVIGVGTVAYLYGESQKGR